MDTRALELCSRLAYKPNALGYCGLETAQKRLYSCMVHGKCSGVKKEIKEFIVLYPYLKTIADAVGKNPFSYDVVEAYWFGNDFLNEIRPEHYTLLMKNLREQGVSAELIRETERRVPKQFIPVHLFNILHIGVGKISMSVPFNLHSINNCMVRWGNVTDIMNDRAVVNLWSLHSSRKLIRKNCQVLYSKDIVGKIKKGDCVIVHWGGISKKITRLEEEKISLWTKRLLKSLT